MTGLSAIFPEGSKARAAADRLQQRSDTPSLLAPEPFDDSLTDQLVSTDGTSLLSPSDVRDVEMAEAARAGLLLWNDAFEASHGICQGIESQVGSYWHALCHRREGHRGGGLESNMANARHWFRRVGEHPVFKDLYAEALRIGGPDAKRKELEQRGAWDPFLFIDWCLACEQGEDRAGREMLKGIQAAEMRLLLEYCVRHAC